MAVFSTRKEDFDTNNEELKICVENEFLLTKRLISILPEDSKIGFEMTNHYYYNLNLLFEKLVLLKEIMSLLK